MRQQYDYYKILQVHNLAEPEIIESAYKRLARKYHPDANPNGNAGEKMQMINEAYTVLSNPGKRQEYNKEWEKINRKPDTGANSDNNTFNAAHPNNEKMFVSAKHLLDDYFKNIMNKNYSDCYELISAPDKRNISKEEFISWQDAVSKIYCIKEYNCEFYGVYRDKLMNGRIYHDILEFNIRTVEYNIVMEMVQRDNFTKLVLLEDNEWRIYIGYEKLQPIINKFQNLKGLLNAKTVMNELMERYNKVDISTGLLNQRGILENIEREIQRYERYGNVFSMILCDFNLISLINRKEEKELTDRVLITVGELLTGNLRKLDLVGRWSDSSLLILLPETGLLPAIKVSHKIQKILKEKCRLFDDKSFQMVVDYGITEYFSSLEEALDRIYSQIR